MAMSVEPTIPRGPVVKKLKEAGPLLGRKMNQRLEQLRIRSIVNSDQRDGEIELGKEIGWVGGHGSVEV
jgi:hypothetical protein